MTKDEALKLALEALEFVNQTGDTQTFDMCYASKAINAIREALAQPEQNLNCKSTQARLATVWGYVKAQPEQEPVRVMGFNCVCGRRMEVTADQGVVPAPHRKPLTDEEIRADFDIWWFQEGSGPMLPSHDCEEHTKRMCEIAWKNGAYKATHGIKE